MLLLKILLIMIFIVFAKAGSQADDIAKSKLAQEIAENNSKEADTALKAAKSEKSAAKHALDAHEATGKKLSQEEITKFENAKALFKQKEANEKKAVDILKERKALVAQLKNSAPVKQNILWYNKFSIAATAAAAGGAYWYYRPNGYRQKQIEKDKLARQQKVDQAVTNSGYAIPAETTQQQRDDLWRSYQNRQNRRRKI